MATAQPIPGSEWESLKTIIVAMYTEENNTLAQLVHKMKTEHNFNASESQYIRKLRQWGIKKYSTREKWRYVDEQVRKRQLEGKETEVILNGKVVSAKRLKKEVGRYCGHDAASVEHTRNAPDGIEFQDLVEPSVQLIAQGGFQAISSPEPIEISQATLTTTGMNQVFDFLNLDSPFLANLEFSWAMGDGDNNISLDMPTPAFLGGQFTKAGDCIAPPNSWAPLVSAEKDREATRKLLRACLGISVDLESAEYLPKVSSALEDIIIERSDGDLVRQVKNLHGGSPLESACQLLGYIIFLSSNNQLTEVKMDHVMHWLIENDKFWIAENMIKCKQPTTEIFASQLLLSATRLEKAEIIQKLLSHGVDPNTLAGIQQKQTALQLAVNLSNASLVSLLLDAGADPNAHEKITTVMMPLEIAVRAPASGLEIAQMLLSKDAKVNAPLKFDRKNTLLNIAISDGNVELAKMLLKAGANIDQVGDMIESPLQIAASKNNLELVELLVDAGADVDAPSGRIYKAMCKKAAKKRYYEFFQTAIQYAAEFDNVEMVQILLDAGADVNAFPAGCYIPQLKNDNIDDNNAEHEIKTASSDSEDDRNSEDGNSEVHDLEESEDMDLDLDDLDLGGLGYIDDFGEEEDDGAIYYSMWIDSEKIHTALHAAVRNNNIVLARLLISLGADINRIGSHGTALQTALGMEPVEMKMVRLLLSKGANVNSPAWGPEGSTALQAAAASGDLDLVGLLLEKGANVNAPAHRMGGCTALQAAVSSTNMDLVKNLLGAGAKINAPGHLTILEIAVCRGCVKMVRFLIGAGADVNNQPGHSTAIQRAVALGKTEIVKLLISAGANINAIAAPVHGKTCLQSAIANGDHEMINLLLREGADIHAPAAAMEGGGTALQYAAGLGQFPLVERFLAAGADLNQNYCPKGGNSALGHAVLHGHYDLARFLIMKGADPNHGSKSLLTAIAMGGVTEMVQSLINAGAKVNGSDEESTSPLQQAACVDEIDTIRALIDAGADINCVTMRKGRTPLQEAIFNENSSLVDFLLSKGADPNRVSEKDHKAPILMAAKNWKCHSHILPALIEHGAYLNAHGGCPINVAARMGFKDVVRILHKAGAEVNTRKLNEHVWTALQHAVTSGKIDLVEMLDAGANVNDSAAPDGGETALQAAASRGFLKIAKLLLSRGADVNSPAAGKNGATALQKAAIAGHLGLSLLLLKEGADINAPPATTGGRTALDAAAEHGRLDILYLFLRNDKDLETLEARCKKAAKMAAGNGHSILAGILRNWKVQNND